MYFSRDIERGLGLENHLENYYLASVEESYIVDQLNANSERAFCLSAYDKNIDADSTLQLITNSNTKEWIKNIVGDKNFYAQLFQFSQPVIFNLEKLGATVLNNSASMNRKFEDKLSQAEVFNAYNLNFPAYKIVKLNNQKLEEITNNRPDEIGTPLCVVQINRAHTGSGTFFVKNEVDWDHILLNHKGNEVKISDFIRGDSYTINGCVTKKGIFVAGLQYQITGIQELTHGEGSTVGNDFTYANRLEDGIKQKIFNMAKKVGEVMEEQGYRGLFGIDIVVDNHNVYLIEVNARQTANISLQTKLELIDNKIPLAVVNLAEWLDIEIEFEPSDKIEPLVGSQIFLRSRTDNFEISENLKSGIYRLQSDNAARLKPDEDVINIDEEKDKPLIWQREGYSVEDLNNDGFVLLVQKIGNKRNSFDEIARMQFDKGIILVQNGKTIISPWVLEAMREILERVG